MQTALGAWVAPLLIAGCASPALSADYYFMAVLGAQRPVVNLPRYAHSFAVFVRAGTCGPGEAPRLLEFFPISWLPAVGPVETIRVLPEPGRNYGLHETLNEVLAQGDRVSLWGPYQIRRELYERALAQRARLESGAVRYKAVDTGYPAWRVSNCIHAISDLSEQKARLRIASPGWGETASYYITLWLADEILVPQQTHPWVAQVLGLNRYPIVSRDLAQGNPNGLSILGTVQSVLHHDLFRPISR